MPDRTSLPADVLLVAAFEPELADLRATIGDGTPIRIDDTVVAARVVGIGMAAAAAGAALAIAEARPRAVVLIGTCGAYGGGPLALGDVIVSRCVRLVDPSALSGTAQFPAKMATAIDSSDPLRMALTDAGARAADVATTLAITVNDAAAGFIARASATEVEHLEAFAVAVACAAAGVAFAAVLGVANVVGTRAREQWQANHHRVAARAASVVLHWLRDGAPRLTHS